MCHGDTIREVSAGQDDKKCAQGLKVKVDSVQLGALVFASINNKQNSDIIAGNYLLPCNLNIFSFGFFIEQTGESPHGL